MAITVDTKTQIHAKMDILTLEDALRDRFAKELKIKRRVLDGVTIHFQFNDGEELEGASIIFMRAKKKDRDGDEEQPG